MQKIKLLEALAESSPDERSEFADRLLFDLQNRGQSGQMTLEFVEQILRDMVSDYEIDKIERAL